MKTAPISVVIPVYNREDKIERCLRSVLGQTLSPCEILVVDDGSTDGTINVVEELGDARIRMLNTSGRLGPGSARALGIGQAVGDWIALLDSDDWWEPEKLQRQFQEVQSLGDNVASAHSYHYHTRSGCVLQEFSGPKGDIGEYLFCELGQFHTSSILASRKLMVAHPYTGTLSRHEDWLMLLQMEKAGARFHFLSAPLGHREAASGRGARAKYSMEFFDHQKEWMSSKARLGFLVNVVLRKAVLQKDFPIAVKSAYQSILVSLGLGISALGVWWEILLANCRYRFYRAFQTRMGGK